MAPMVRLHIGGLYRPALHNVHYGRLHIGLTCMYVITRRMSPLCVAIWVSLNYPPPYPLPIPRPPWVRLVRVFPSGNPCESAPTPPLGRDRTPVYRRGMEGVWDSERRRDRVLQPSTPCFISMPTDHSPHTHPPVLDRTPVWLAPLSPPLETLPDLHTKKVNSLHFLHVGSKQTSLTSLTRQTPMFIGHLPLQFQTQARQISPNQTHPCSHPVLRSVLF